MDTPTAKQLCDATGISPSYAHMILNGDRQPKRGLAIFILRQLGWKHESISDLTDEQIEVFEQVEPWTPTVRKAA